MTPDQFQLTRDNAIRPTKIRFTNNPGGQSVLFSGMDCLPGQTDLFPTDGAEDAYDTDTYPKQVDHDDSHNQIDCKQVYGWKPIDERRTLRAAQISCNTFYREPNR